MKKLYAFSMLLLLGVGASAQYSTYSGANAPSVHPGILETVTPTYREYRLTTSNPIEQAGAVWRNAALSLTGNWSVKVQLNFGPFHEGNLDNTKNAYPLADYRTGADGIAMVLSTGQYLGGWGEEMGYGTRNVIAGTYTPNQSLAFEMDTWRNLTTGPNSEGFLNHNETDGNHVAFMSRGNTIHGTPDQLGALKTLTTFDLEAVGWIDAEFSWNDATNTLSVMSTSHPELNSSVVLTDAQISSLFGSVNPTLYIGFTASTGSAGNDHRVRWMNDAPPPSCGQLRTQTQGGWGQDCKDPSKNNPGCYRDANFAAAFPMGVRLGSTAPGGRSLLFSTTGSVQNFLPSGGPNRTLAQLGLPVGSTTYTSGNTGRSNINGQLLALSLSVGFDDNDPNFAPSEVRLGDMIINEGPFEGMTVRNFLAFANQVIGGTASGNLEDIHATATAINENYVDGKMDGGYLRCPTTARTMRAMPAPAVVASLDDQQPTGAVVYPNPSRGQLNVNLGKVAAGAEIQVINSRGNVVARRAAGNAQSVSLDVRQFGTGVYMIKVISEGKVQTLKALVQE
jgi:hypothetical protein